MSGTTLRRGGVALWAVLIVARQAAACSVCYGDPDSDMARGAIAGVTFLVGVVSLVLAGIAAIAFSWAVRARRLDLECNAPPFRG